MLAQFTRLARHTYLDDMTWLIISELLTLGQELVPVAERQTILFTYHGLLFKATSWIEQNILIFLLKFILNYVCFYLPNQPAYDAILFRHYLATVFDTDFFQLIKAEPQAELFHQQLCNYLSTTELVAWNSQLLITFLLSFSQRAVNFEESVTQPVDWLTDLQLLLTDQTYVTSQTLWQYFAKAH